MFLPPTPRRGASLVELIGALVVLELTGLLAMTAALAVGRGQRHADRVGRLDIARLDSVATAQAAPACRNSPTARAQPVTLPSGPGRPALTVSIRCGR